MSCRYRWLPLGKNSMSKMLKLRNFV